MLVCPGSMVSGFTTPPFGDRSRGGLQFDPPHDQTNKMTEHPAKTQISLGICPDWSESSLGAVILLVLSRCGSFLLWYSLEIVSLFSFMSILSTYYMIERHFHPRLMYWFLDVSGWCPALFVPYLYVPPTPIALLQHLKTEFVFVGFICGFTSLSTLFRSCQLLLS